MFAYGSLNLRVIEERDLEPIRNLRNDQSTWMNLTDIIQIDDISQRRWFDSLRGRTDRLYFVLCDSDNDFVGLVRMDEIDRVNRSMRVGCDIALNLRGKGFGTRAYFTILKYCFDFQNSHRVWLAVLEYNATAQKIYKKNGFQVEGRYREAIFRNGKYHDYIIMSVLEPEYRSIQAKEKVK